MREPPDPDRRPRRRRRTGRVGGRRLGRARRPRRAAARRGRLPPRQDLRRRVDPACGARAVASGARGLAAGAHRQPGPARPRLRPDAAAALARRHPALLGQRRAAHRARRPPAHHRDQGRRPGARRRAGRRRRARGRPGACRRRGAARAGRTRRRGALRDRLPPPRGRRRGALAAGQGAGPRVAPRHRLRRRRALLRHLHRVRRPVDQLAPRAARRGRGDPVRLRLDLPPRRRRGEPGRGHAGHREAARQHRGQAADAVLRRRAARGLRALGRAARPDLGAAAHGRRGVGRGRPQLGA